MSSAVSFRSQSGILIATFLLLCVSILMVFSTTAIVAQETMGRSTAYLNKHILQIVLGLFFAFITARLNPRFLGKLALPFLLLSYAGLALVLIPGVGSSAGGATRWLSIGPLRFQPGEFAKFAVVVYMASYIGRHHDEMFSFLKGVLIPLSIVGVYAVLLLAQPDFGSTTIILSVVFLMLLTSARMLHLVSVGAGALCMLGLLIVTSPYRFKRVETFLDPFQEANAAGYQLVQSLIAVGSGGMFGEGLGSGRQKLFYLPAAHTDFIFAVIAEELGFLGVLFVIGLFLVLAWSGLRLARRLVFDPFLCALTVGFTSLIVVPAFLNMGVVLGLLPTKGLVLPLVAYGGTAMVINLGVVGALLRISREEAL